MRDLKLSRHGFNASILCRSSQSVLQIRRPHELTGLLVVRSQAKTKTKMPDSFDLCPTVGWTSPSVVAACTLGQGCPSYGASCAEDQWGQAFLICVILLISSGISYRSRFGLQKYSVSAKTGAAQLAVAVKTQRSVSCYPTTSCVTAFMSVSVRCEIFCVFIVLACPVKSANAAGPGRAAAGVFHT